MKRKMIRILGNLADDPTLPAELRLWAIGALTRIKIGKAVSSAALNSLILRMRAYQKDTPSPSPTPARKPKNAPGTPEIKAPASADFGREEALARIRAEKKV